MCLYRDCYQTGHDEYEEGVEPGEDVPVLQEDGREVVEDDPGAGDAEDAAEDGQEGVRRHGPLALYWSCLEKI